jgi:hypothetical protein
MLALGSEPREREGYVTAWAGRAEREASTGLPNLCRKLPFPEEEIKERIMAGNKYFYATPKTSQNELFSRKN